MPGPTQPLRGTRRSGVAALAALALGWGLAVVPTAAVAPAAHAAVPNARGCPEVQVVWAGGVGSGFAREAIEPLGQGVAVKTVARPAPTLVESDLQDIRARGLSHPHFRGWRTHARAAVKVMDRSARRCPDAVLVLAGHSEGAVAAHRAARMLSQREHRAARRHVGGLWLLGDPLAVTADGTGLARFTGLLAGRGPELPGWVRRAGVLNSSCGTNDPLCDSDDQSYFDLASHYDYGSYSVAWAAERLPADARIVAPAINKAPISVPVDPILPIGVRLDPNGLPGGVRATPRRPLPRGLRLSHGRLVGKAPRGRTTVKLWARGRTVAPAVRRRVTVVLEARKQAAARGTVLVSRGVGGRPANGEARMPRVSGDGRTVAYVSDATNLVRRDLGEGEHGFVWDARTGRTELVSVGPDGGPLATIGGVQVSHDGRVVLFEGSQVWLRDRDTRTSTRVPGAGPGSYPELSGDGRLVTYRDQQTTRRWHADTGVVEDLGVDGLQAVSANGRFLALVRAGRLHIWDTATAADAAVADFPDFPTCAVGVSQVSDDGTYVVRVAGCGHGEGYWSLHEVAGMREVVGAPDLAASADARWTVRGGYDGSITLRPTLGGSGFRIVRKPRWNSPEDFDDSRPSVADDGRAAAYSHIAVDIVPGAYTDVRQVYHWRATR